MATWRRRADANFAALGRAIVARPWLTIALALLPVAFLASQLRFVTFDASTEGFLHANDPVLEDYYAFRDQFGRDELILLALTPPSVFDRGFLEDLRRLHERIEEEVPHLDDVTSLVNARAVRGLENELLVEDLMEEWPETDAELRAIETFARNNPSYRDLLLSRDGTTTTLMIKTSHLSSGSDVDALASGFEDEVEAPKTERPVYLTEKENAEVLQAVMAIVEDFREAGMPIHLAGSPIVVEEVKLNMRTDMLGYVRLTILTIAVFLFLLFRRISAVVLPLVVVIASLVSTVGLMATTGTPFKLPTTTLPSFILAVGVGDSVHILALFFRRLSDGMSRENAIVDALEHAGLPVALTSLTTAGGLLSFAPVALAPISDLGKFAPAGVMMALLLSVILLPALLAVVPLRKERATSGSPEATSRHILDGVIRACGDLATRRPVAIVSFAAVLAVLAFASAMRIDFSHDPLRWLPESSPSRMATDVIDRSMRGSVTLEVLLERDGENAWYEPEPLRQLEAAGQAAEKFESGRVWVGRAFSLVDVLKEIHRALNANRADHYRVPDDRDLIAQEFLLFANSGSDDLEDVVDSQFTTVRLTLKFPFVDANSFADELPRLQELVESHVGSDTRVSLTGVMGLLSRTMTAVMDAVAQTYLIAFAIISVLMMLLLGSVRLGALAMIPNLLPILMALGLMGALGMPLDVFTLLVASISLGLAVDDTIHFMHNYVRYYEQSGDPVFATRQALDTAGRAMLFTTLVLSCGFLIFTLSSMGNVFNFGLLTAFALTMALLADFLLAPALMQLVHRGKQN